MKDISLVIFDCDGVLIDSEGLSGEVLTGALAEIGVYIDHDEFCTRMVGRSFPTVAAEIRATRGVDLPETFEATYRSRLLARFEIELVVTDGLEAVLDDLDVPWCIATSSSPARVRKSLELTGLSKRFAHVFTASEVPHGKPAPDLFLHAAAVMATPPSRCLVIEDSLPGVAAAEAAGMRLLRYTGGAHLRGRHLKHGENVVTFEDWRQFPALMKQAMQS